MPRLKCGSGWGRLVLDEDSDTTYVGLTTAYRDFAKVAYNSRTYMNSSFDEKNYGLKRASDGTWDSSIGALVIEPQETALFRAFVGIPVEPESLEEPFEITFSLPDSSGGAESFTFAVND